MLFHNKNIYKKDVVLSSLLIHKQKKMPSKLCFESLANELILEIFEYLPSIDLLRAYFNLNQRFNQLLIQHFQFYSLNFRSISYANFKLITHDYLPTQLIHSITSIHLSNNDDTPEQIDLFYQYGLKLSRFDALTSLFIYDFNSSDSSVLFDIQSLENLIHLTLAGCYFQFTDQQQHQSFIDHIWTLSKLNSCYLNIHFNDDEQLFKPQRRSLSLKSLSLWGIERQIDEFNEIINQTPNLEHLSILLRIDTDQSLSTNFSASLIKKFELSCSRIDESFSIVPNLSCLTIDLDEFLFDGYQWSNLIENNLPKLEKFRLRMTFQYFNIDSLVQSFQTDFWLQKHQWYIRCHWNITNKRSILYTLPYYFKDFELDFSMKFISTGDNFNYKSVTDLSCNNSEISSDTNLQQIISNFDRINSLDISMDNTEQLSYFFKQFTNRTIHQIDLRKFDRYFTINECHEISQILSTTIQCESLLIKIQNRFGLIPFLTNMKHLRALNIQCLDDDEYLLAWIQLHLSSASLIKRDVFFIEDIQIWS